MRRRRLKQRKQKKKGFKTRELRDPWFFSIKGPSFHGEKGRGEGARSSRRQRRRRKASALRGVKPLVLFT